MKLPVCTVTAYRFESGVGIPRRLEIDGITYDCKERGIRMRIASAEAQCLLATFTDGIRTLYMRADTRGSTWELVKIA